LILVKKCFFLTCSYLGEAISRNPGYLKLRKIRAAQNISRTIANSQNKVYLSGNSLMLNISDKEFDDQSDKLKRNDESVQVAHDDSKTVVKLAQQIASRVSG
jgi:prohibitin 2